MTAKQPIDGDLGNHTIEGTPRSDIIFGYGKHNWIRGHGGRDLIHGGQGNDTVEGGDGDDALHGQDGDDYLIGGAGRDSLYGGEGNDTLEGGPGDDVLRGGMGHDFYIYRPGDGVDRIDDVGGLDTLILKEIYRKDIALVPIENNYVAVFWRGELIVRMRGVDFVQTEDGCFALSQLLPPS